MHKNELLDLVDDQDNVTGTIYRSDFYQQEDNPPGYIRAIELLIQNDHGQLWIPTRGMHKTIAPGALDYSCGGHVDSGETYIEAGLREIQEELNLTLTEQDLDEIHTFGPRPGLPYFRRLYVLRSNESPDYNPADFTSAEWLTPAEVFAKAEAGVLVKNSFLETLRFYVERLSGRFTQ